MWLRDYLYSPYNVEQFIRMRGVPLFIKKSRIWYLYAELWKLCVICFVYKYKCWKIPCQCWIADCCTVFHYSVVMVTACLFDCDRLVFMMNSYEWGTLNRIFAFLIKNKNVTDEKLKISCFILMVGFISGFCKCI